MFPAKPKKAFCSQLLQEARTWGSSPQATAWAGTRPEARTLQNHAK